MTTPIHLCQSYYDDDGQLRDCTCGGGCAVGVLRHTVLDSGKARTAKDVLDARIDEVKRSLHKGYFIPEMEVQAEDRLAELQNQRNALDKREDV